MTQNDFEPIAIVGISCRFPAGANSPEELWSLISQGKSAWSDVPEDRFNWKSFLHPSSDVVGMINSRGGHFIDQDIRTFDAGFFGIPPAEANAMDPQHRLQLETAYEALENAGISLEKVRGSSTSVYVAIFNRDYDRMMFKDTNDIAKYHLLGSGEAIASNRISYTFDLKGPSMTVDTGCSGSLVALHQACQGLRSGDTDMALVGGTSLILSPDTMVPMSRMNVLDPSGKSFVFDDRGVGYGRGEGVATIVLKRLKDALNAGDHVRAVIRNTGINQDGKTSGIALPSQVAQQALANHVFKQVGLDPCKINYVEAHGTGTIAGDLAETKSIANVFCTERRKTLYIGSIKSNIGHLESASGAAGLLKAILVLEKGLIPPHVNLSNHKKGLDLEQSNIVVPSKIEKLSVDEDGKSRIAINSFGYGGTNAHAILETAPLVSTSSDFVGRFSLTNSLLPLEALSEQISKLGSQGSMASAKLFSLSAKSKASLIENIKKLRIWASEFKATASNNQLENLSYTLNQRRSVFQWRSSIVASTFEELIQNSDKAISEVTKASANVSVAFVFTGQGAQWASMGLELFLSNPTFRKSMQTSDQILRDLGCSWSLIKELFGTDQALSCVDQSIIAHPATTALQIALVDLFRSLRLTPSAVLGHSSGEIGAAYAAGALSHAVAIAISYYRSLLSGIGKKTAATKGAMLAVGLGEAEVTPFIQSLRNGKVVIACSNSSMSTTISGDETAIMELQHALESRFIFTRKLKVDTAYHSHHMELVAGQYFNMLTGLTHKDPDPKVLFVSSVTAGKKTTGFGPAYWVENLVSKVRFSDALEYLCQSQALVTGTSSKYIILEIGPHSTLSAPIRQVTAQLSHQSTIQYLPSLIRHQDSTRCILDSVRRLYDCSYTINLTPLNDFSKSGIQPEVVADLPSYSWDHGTPYWHESRLSLEHRLRKSPYHDLLGLALKKLPWLADHVIDGSIIFPGAGYLCMAIEAIRGLLREQGRHHDTILRYVLRNISFSKSLTIPSSSNHVEIQLGFDLGKNQNDRTLVDWIGFDVSSFQNNSWKQHCSGNIKVEFHMPADEVEELREATFVAASETEMLQECSDGGAEPYEASEFYAKIKALGNDYGPKFATIRKLMVGDFHSTATISTPTISECMPSNFMQPHVIHPATMDAIFQAALPLYLTHCINGPVMPVYIDQLTVNSNVSAAPAMITSLAFQRDLDNELNCVLKLSNGELKGLGDAHPNGNFEKALPRSFTHTIQWNVDVNFMTTRIFRQYLSPAMNEAEIAKRQAAIDKVAALYIHDFLHDAKDTNVQLPKHFSLLLQWMQKYSKTKQYYKLISNNSVKNVDMILSEARTGIEGDFLRHLGERLVSIMSGSSDALSLMLEEDRLGRYYANEWLSKASSHLVKYLDLLSFKRPNLVVLEIGAGTGGTTFPVLQQLGNGNNSIFKRYDYTDISSGFFEGARSKFQNWSNLLEYKTLNIEIDPLEQGFEEASYDVVIASNVLHATKNVTQTLENVRRLLKPGGKLAFVEITRFSPMHNMTFGLLPGWWAGIDDGRQDTPILSVTQWNDALLRSSFNGVEVAASDFDGPASLCDLLVSTYTPTSVEPELEIEILESEYIFRDDRVFIPRLIPNAYLNSIVTSTLDITRPEPVRFQQSQRALKLHVEVPGLLDSMIFQDDKSKETPLEDDKVEIEVKACGVNFKDVFIALGQMRSTDQMVGECSGIISSVGANLNHRFRVGDRVWSLVATPYANFARSLGCTVYKIPDSMSFLTAASIPVVFTTAYYSLVNVAKLKKGQTVLIHAASGGVGQAALMIAKSIGAEIIATVGSLSKAEMLMERYNIAKSHIFSSRSLNFSSGIRRLTNGGGVDVVLNSLAGEAMQESWHCVAPMGTFVEIGKNDIYRRGNLSLEPFERNITFASVDMTLVVKHQSEKLQPIFENVMKMFNDEELRPVYPLMDMPISHVEQAFRLIQARKHMGKIVLDADNSSPVTVSSPISTPVRLDSHGTYLVVGGLGGLGRVIIRFLVSHGAKHVLILSRRAHEEKSKPLMTEIESHGAHCKIITCDVSNNEDCIQAIANAQRTMPTIHGVIQAAMVLQDRTLEKMTAEDYKVAIDPKVLGTQNLLSSLDVDQLKFFIILSSCSTIAGNASQANYSAACSFQDAVAQLHSQAYSDPRITSLNLGIIEGSESLEDVSDNAIELLRQSCVPIKMEEFLSLLEFSMRPEAREHHFVQIAIGLDRESISNRKDIKLQSVFNHLPGRMIDLDSAPVRITKTIGEELSAARSINQIKSIVTTAIATKLSALTASDASELDIDAPIENLGLDSLIAIELKNWINRSLRATLQTSDILDAPNIRFMSSTACEKSELVTKHPHSRITEDETSNGNVSDPKIKIQGGASSLPRLPLPELESTLQFYETSVQALCSEEEIQQLRTAIKEFQKTGSIGVKLQDRLRERQSNPNLECWLADLYCPHVYLRNRFSISPYGNFMTVHTESIIQHEQAERAAIVTLAAIQFKEDLEAQKVLPVLLNDQPICMNALEWLFNAIRAPCSTVDQMQKFPSQDYVAVLRRGCIYKITLHDASGHKIEIDELRDIFELIIEFGKVESTRKSIAGLTADRRDSWSQIYQTVRNQCLENSNTVDMIEKSAFVVCLDDGSPNTTTERSNQFLLGDICNRWSDKTLQLVVCTNGESGHIFEHSMIDALAVSRFDESIRKAILSYGESSSDLSKGQNGINGSSHINGASFINSKGSENGTNGIKHTDGGEWLKEYQYTTTTEIELHIASLEERYSKSYSPSETYSFTGNQFGSLYLRSHNVSPKSAYQVIIQLASLMYFGYHPPSFQTISMALFNKGRVELMQAVLPETLAFTNSAFNEDVSMQERRELFIKAAKTHAATTTRISRGRGFATHLYALREVLKDGEESPALFNLPLYSRIRPGKLMTDNANRREVIREMAFTMPDPENVLLHYELDDHKCDFVIKAPPKQSKIFFEAIEKACVLVRKLLGNS
ncbi:Lovastatin diketide synthase LovF 12 [Botrytis cinerea]